jgi:hypothetical protein
MVLPFFCEPLHSSFCILRGKMSDKFRERQAQA